MDFAIGLFVGLFIGGWIGLCIASLMMISRESEIREKINDGCDEAIKDAIETLKRQGAPTCLTDDERRKELEERYKRE